MADDCLNELTRAADILLGAVGVGGEATVLSVEWDAESYRGRAAWEDGEEFSFESDWEPDELELWALEILSSAVSESSNSECSNSESEQQDSEKAGKGGKAA